MPLSDADIIDAARKPKKGGHSPLYWELWKRYGTLAGELNHHGAHWDAVAAELAKQGFKDGRGNQPTGRTVQDTWRKVRRHKTEGRAARKPRVKRSRINRAFRGASKVGAARSL